MGTQLKFIGPLAGQLDALSDWYSEGRRFIPKSGHTISKAILSLSLIHVGQLSVTGKSMGT